MANTDLTVKTPELLNALTNKFVDLEGLRIFWENAKSYVDTQDDAVLKAAKDYTDAVNITLTENNVNGQLVSLEITPDAAGREFTLTLDETALAQKLSDLEGAISGGTFFRGVFASKDEVENPKNGDVIAVGNKEYIYYAESEAEDKWIELGDTTAEGQRIGALEGRMDAAEAAIAGMDAEYALDAEAETVENEIAVVTGVNLTQVDGKITAMTVDSAKAATTTYVDNAVNGIGIGNYYTKGEVDDLLELNLGAAKVYTDEVVYEVAGEYSEGETAGTGLRGEIEARDAETLEAAKGYTDEAIEGVKSEIGISNYYTKGEVDGLLTANSTADQAYADGVAATAEENANTYTDNAIAAIEFTFASHADIDGIFGVSHE